MSILAEQDIMTNASKLCKADWYSISGTVSAFFFGETNEIHIKADEVVDCDITRLRRTADGDYIIRGGAQTLRRHGVFEVGANVQVLVRSAWSHVLIDQGKPIVWVEPK